MWWPSRGCGVHPRGRHKEAGSAARRPPLLATTLAVFRRFSTHHPAPETGRSSPAALPSPAGCGPGQHKRRIIGSLVGSGIDSVLLGYSLFDLY